MKILQKDLHKNEKCRKRNIPQIGAEKEYFLVHESRVRVRPSLSAAMNRESFGRSLKLSVPRL